ncbi:protein QNR-71 isoform X2 [Limanda limanda]|uniref:protein QNR-71 isoform X2 n=1 Tax=Limanda limanda TaxID=27771 RepID=UPI0029C629D8|nr:protein QNR-71 isoform X2 [Limanda limanda]
MEVLPFLFLLACACFVYQADGRRTYSDMFTHKHDITGKFPFPIPPIPGWDPDTSPWNDYLYPPLIPKPKGLTHGGAKPKVRLTSDSPALNGSSVSFTAKLEYPPCQKEDANGDLVWDDHCGDGTELEASANGQVRSGYVYNWTSWMDDYGFGKCTDKKKCNVFPDGKPFPQSNDWRHKGYVYVWHTMGQYYETCDGSSSSVTINTSAIPLGAEIMEVMVYRKRERRKYSPLTTDNTVFYVTDKIPVAVEISQKAAVNESKNVFFGGEDVLFKVQLHDPSGYLKTAEAIDYIWDFRDGNQLVTHREVTAHSYSMLGTMSVKLVVEAAFPAECPPAAATTTPGRPVSTRPTEAPTTPGRTHAATVKMETTQAPRSTSRPLPSSAAPTSTGLFSTEPLPPTDASTTLELDPTALAGRSTRRLNGNQCYRYVHGVFNGNITIIAHSDMLTHKQDVAGKFPFPIPPIPGWDPDTIPWIPKPKELMHGGEDSDMLTHKNDIAGKFPFPIPSIPGWDPDTIPWPPKPKELMHGGEDSDMLTHKNDIVGKFPFPIPSIPGFDPDTIPWPPKPKELMHGGEPIHALNSQMSNTIVDVLAARVTKTDISFLVKCLGITPTSACTIVSDPTCTQVRSIMCDDVPPSSECEVHLRRTFPEPGTYCVNITLQDSSSLALASTTVTINKSQDPPASKAHGTAAVVLSSSAVLVAVFALIAYIVYKRHKVYRPIRRSLVEDASGHAGVGGHMVRLRETLFPPSEESRHLLTERRPL